MAGDFIGSLSLFQLPPCRRRIGQSLCSSIARLAACPRQRPQSTSLLPPRRATPPLSTSTAPALPLPPFSDLFVPWSFRTSPTLSGGSPQFSHQDFNISDSLKSRTMDEARVWATEGLDMLSTIRADVCSHLPDVPFDAAFVEDLCKTHLHDFSLPRIIDDIRSRLPDVPHLRSSFSAIDFSDMQSKFKGVCSQLPAVPAELHPRNILTRFRSDCTPSIPIFTPRIPSLPTVALPYPHRHPSQTCSTKSYPRIMFPTSSTELTDRKANLRRLREKCQMLSVSL